MGAPINEKATTSTIDGPIRTTGWGGQEETEQDACPQTPMRRGKNGTLLLVKKEIQGANQSFQN